MNTISREYRAELVLQKAGGLMAWMYLGAKAYISISVRGEESTFSERTGDLVASSSIDKVVGKNGKPIGMDSFDTGIENKLVHISAGKVEYVGDSRTAKVSATMLFSEDGREITKFSMLVEAKGTTSIAVNNLLFVGSGGQIGADVVTPQEEGSSSSSSF